MTKLTKIVEIKAFLLVSGQYGYVHRGQIVSIIPGGEGEGGGLVLPLYQKIPATCLLDLSMVSKGGLNITLKPKKSIQVSVEA